MVYTIMNLSRINSHRSRTGFTLFELMIVIFLLGILGSISVKSMVQFREQRKLRSVALEVIGMIQEKRAQVAAQRLTSPYNCLSLDPADPSSPINQGMVSEVSGLGVTVEGGATLSPICFTPEGLMLTPITLVLSSPTVASQGDWCVVITPPLAQPHLGWRPNGQSCASNAAGGAL